MSRSPHDRLTPQHRRHLKQLQRDGMASSSAEQTPSQPAPGEAASLAMTVVDAIFKTAYLMHRSAERLVDSDVSGRRAHVLMVVGEMAPVRMGDLAAQLGVTARTITTMVDALERDALLARQPDPLDRRATLLALTPVGQARIGELTAIERQISEALLTALDETQREQLLELLNLLKASLSAHGNQRDDTCPMMDNPFH
jgi:DNA-binding MarR family transcriptional regulator